MGVTNGNNECYGEFMTLEEFVKMKRDNAPEWANWLAELHPNTWYYVEFDIRNNPTETRHYKLAGIFEHNKGEWIELC